MGVRGLPTDFATVHIYAGTPETGAKLAKTILHLRKLSTAAGADLQVVASGRIGRDATAVIGQAVI